MNKIVGTTLVAAALAALGPASASAQLVQEICGPAAAHVCVTAKFVLVGTGTLDVFFYNGSSGQGGTPGNGWESVMTGFEIAGIPGAASDWTLANVYYNDYTGGVLQNDGSVALAGLGGWAQSSGISGLNGIVGIANGDGPSGNGGVSACAGPGSAADWAPGTKWFTTCQGNGTGFAATDDWLKFRFTYSPNNLANLNGLKWGYKAQAVEGLNGNSLECQDYSAGAQYCAPTTGGGGGPLAVTPEPATMSLMAFGLVGMAAAARRRRRKA